MPLIFVRFVSPDCTNSPATSAEAEAESWQRADDEAEAAFLERVSTDLRSSHSRCSLVFLS